MNLRSRIAIGVVFGVVIIVLPFELFLLGFVVWGPLLFYFAFKDGIRRSVSVLGPFSVVVAIGILVPSREKWERFGPFETKEVTLAQLGNARAVFVPPGHEEDRIVLPSKNPNRAEIWSAVTNQTQWQGSEYHCASGSCMILGPSVSPIILKERKQ